ncbi:MULTISPECIES: TonB-dependent receptor plug domain-containing protein [unclassified Pedobacter]|uniref:TonB-dependent receptor plug domain-containing protein n=1 Tax=unclassified Pedobacter TaxID=2628915 RepID=UPI001423D2B0|nr:MULTISPECIES: TonB-dependent receptor plug domain-containing protein [unclassified Pedobacter]NII84742.1 TonB-dependent SusC/RagA subfamily outer membrane receptor [Pedobacter sp. SG908]NMN38348.1 TonB-dependent SusC/RagA subfamily outer membrane receptor [Pedobacter sp. SG918]
MKNVIIFGMLIGFSLASFAQKADSSKTPKVNLRGISTSGTEPLIIIDGNKQYIRGTSSLNDIDPNNIETVSILKDSLATARYGADGFAGVIEVKTKNGSLNNNYGLKAAPIKIDESNLKGKVSGFSVRPSIPNIDTPKKVRYLLNRDFDPKVKLLYIIDGKEVSEIKSLDQESIESIEVLKGSSAGTLHGDKGKNGVVIITTKKSKATSKKN